MENRTISVLKFFIVILLGIIFVGMFIRFREIKANEALASFDFLKISGDTVIQTETAFDENISSDVYFRDDIMLLANLIEQLCEKDDYTQKVAVAAAVINRIDSPLFADSLRDVISEPGAFMNFTPGVNNFSQLSLTAAVHAANGYDPTFGAVFFYETQWDTQQSKRPITTVIGNKTFTK